MSVRIYGNDIRAVMKGVHGTMRGSVVILPNDAALDLDLSVGGIALH